MIDAAGLREVLDYDPETGIFRWVRNRGSRIKAWAIAGSADHEGYWIIGFDKRNYRAHRLAWLYVHGRWPTGQLDHKNCVRSDNRIANLREATPAQNAQNRRLSKSNSLGVKGVCRYGKKFLARIKINGRLLSLGVFNTTDEAQSAFSMAAKARYGEFANLGV